MNLKILNCMQMKPFSSILNILPCFFRSGSIFCDCQASRILPAYAIQSAGLIPPILIARRTTDPMLVRQVIKILFLYDLERSRRS